MHAETTRARMVGRAMTSLTFTTAHVLQATREQTVKQVRSVMSVV